MDALYLLRGEAAVHTPEKIKELRTQMIEHLEAALALADETRDSATGFVIETALDSARADQWPTLNPRFDARPEK